LGVVTIHAFLRWYYPGQVLRVGDVSADAVRPPSQLGVPELPGVVAIPRIVGRVAVGTADAGSRRVNGLASCGPVVSGDDPHMRQERFRIGDRPQVDGTVKSGDILLLAGNPGEISVELFGSDSAIDRPSTRVMTSRVRRDPRVPGSA
jgi:hypothetical protein